MELQALPSVPSLPSAPDVEWALLGALFADPSAWKALAALSESHFHGHSTRKLFRACREIVASGGRPDTVTVMDALGPSGVAGLGHDRYSGAQVLASVQGRGSVHPDQIDVYVRILRDRHARREVVGACLQALGDAQDESFSSAQEILDRLNSRLSEAQPQAEAEEGQAMGQLLEVDFRNLQTQQEVDNQGLCGIPTSLTALDDLTGGYEPGQLIVLGAYPGGGKTSLALQTALCCALEGHSVRFKSLEMSGYELRTRLLSGASGVPSWRIRKSGRSNPLNEREWRQLENARHALSGLGHRLILDDGPEADPAGIVAAVRRQNAGDDPVRLLVVDYLQLLDIPHREQVDAVAGVTRSLKQLAMNESNRGRPLSVLLLTQLTKPQGDVPRRPTMHSVRGSGLIGADADKILLVHREEQFLRASGCPVDPEKVGLAEIIVAKQRNGDVGVVNSRFEGETCSFHDWDRPSPAARA